MAQIRVNAARLTVIKKRQGEDRWGADYVPSIFATPKEAPGISRPSIILPLKLGGRETHLLSHPELYAALLALYHPLVWELHEQKILSPGPRPHFLSLRESSSSQTWPSIKGTLDVAERLDMFSRHPKVRFSNAAGQLQYAPFPYIGDLLLFLRDALGPYCVNWPIKDKYAAFKKRGPQLHAKPHNNEVDLSAQLRQQLEETYYLDADIRTVQVAGDAIDKQVRSNLRDLFLHHGRALAVAADIREPIIHYLRNTIGSQIPAFKSLGLIQQRYQLDRETARALLHQAIWQRELRVDLFQPVLMDRPLKPERVDVIDHYAAWFAR